MSKQISVGIDEAEVREGWETLNNLGVIAPAVGRLLQERRILRFGPT